MLALEGPDHATSRQILLCTIDRAAQSIGQRLAGCKGFELGHADKLEMPVLYAWNSSTGEPELFTGLVLDPKKRNAIWKSNDIPARLEPLFLEPDFDKRMAGYRAFERWSVEQGYAFPLLLNTATIVHSSKIGYVPYRNGWLLPATWSLS